MPIDATPPAVIYQIPWDVRRQTPEGTCTFAQTKDDCESKYHTMLGKQYYTCKWTLDPQASESDVYYCKFLK